VKGALNDALVAKVAIAVFPETLCGKAFPTQLQSLVI